jgi:hypothetical protein
MMKKQLHQDNAGGVTDGVPRRRRHLRSVPTAVPMARAGDYSEPAAEMTNVGGDDDAPGLTVLCW